MTLESAGQFQLNLTERLRSQRPWIPSSFMKQTVGCRAATEIGDLSEGKARPCCCRWERAPRAELALLRSCLLPCQRQRHQKPAFMNSTTTRSFKEGEYLLLHWPNKCRIFRFPASLCVLSQQHAPFPCSAGSKWNQRETKWRGRGWMGGVMQCWPLHLGLELRAQPVGPLTSSVLYSESLMNVVSTLRPVVKGPKPPQVALGNARWGVRHKAALLKISPTRKHVSHSWKQLSLRDTNRLTMILREGTHSMLAVVTGPGFPRCPCPFHSWKRTVVVKWDCGFYTYFLQVLASGSQWAQSCLVCGGSVEGTWRKREAFKKYLGARKAFHLASARSSAECSVSFLVWNLLSGPEKFNKTWAEGATSFSLFPAPGMQGAFHHQVFLSNSQWNACVLCFCYC